MGLPTHTSPYLWYCNVVANVQQLSAVDLSLQQTPGVNLQVQGQVQVEGASGKVQVRVQVQVPHQCSELVYVQQAM